MRKTKVVITLGPSTDSPSSIEKLIKKGVNVFRLNFSHATHEYHKESIEKIREASKKVGKEAAILQDIAGPKIRICHLKKPIELSVGDKLTITKQTVNEDEKIVYISYPTIIDDLEVGDPIYFSDGTIRAKVIEKNEQQIICETIVAGTLQSKKGMNLPKSNLTIKAITEKDKKDLIFGAKNGVDLVALSFVSDENDIKCAREILEKEGANPFIFAKIEKQEAIANIKKILQETDGIMVARGDMGVELGLQKVPHVQKDIIKKANELGKPTITATQMLTSMISSPYPTRAEISDIANAVLDGTDAVMLSDETTIGKYPVEAVEVLNETINETEKDYPYYKNTDNVGYEDFIAAAVTTLAKNIKPHALISFTRAGRSTMSMAKFRPKEKMLVSSFDINTLRKLQVVWGIDTIYLSQKLNDADMLIKSFLNSALEKKQISLDKKYVLTIGSPINVKHSTNDIRILEKESMEYLLEKKM
jgi:pyruvate kinase